MKNIFKQISISSLLLLSSIFLPINSFEVERFVFPLNTVKNNLIASRGNIKTVITIGYGKTIEEASQNAAENALKQVVGTFIDSETLIKKKKEISNGIVKLSKTIKRDTQDYSQGSIQYFEILKIKDNNGILSVEAKVEVLEGEFSNYIKKFAFDESNFPGPEISTMIEKNLDNNKSKAKLITKKIVQPLEEGSVYNIKVGDWRIINNWKLFCSKFKNRYGQEIGKCNSFLNDDKVIVASVDISLDKKFFKNAETILENIKSQKFKVPFIEYNTYDKLLYPYNKFENDGLGIGLIQSNNQESEIYLIKDVRKTINDELVKKYNSQIDFSNNDLRKSRFNNLFAIPLLMFGYSETRIDQEKVGVFEYGGPVIKFYDSNNKLTLKYACNAYECPLNDNVNFFRISEGVIPRFSLFGCYDTDGGTSCIPTIISNSRYLLAFTFPTEEISKIKNIKVEYQKQPGYLPKGVWPYRNLIGF